MKKIVFVFGNQDVDIDNATFQYIDRLKSDFDNLSFVKVAPNADAPFADEKSVVIFDTVQGIKSIKIFDERDIDKLTMSPRNSVHDFDLGFQLKYLMKLGKLKQFLIVALPMGHEVSYSSIHDTFKKFVAQDIQGS